jgi:hypothetical protein
MSLPCALALILLALDDRPMGPASPTPLNASVMIFNEWGLKDASEQVERIARTGQGKVNFVVTIHCRLDPQLRPLDYGLIRAEEGWRYTPFDDELLGQFRASLRVAFAEAVVHKLDIAILPHVDAAGPQFGWRNRYDLDPLADCGGYSYQRALIDPIADALEGAVGPETGVEFALTGEMGRTVFANPNAYLRIIQGLRRRERLGHLKTGVSINFNEVTGTFQPSEAQLASVRRLLAASDFLGFSCYGVVGVPPKADDFTRIVHRFVEDLKRVGVQLPKGLALHFSEVGLGGGGQTGRFEDIGIARTPEEAARSPWSGTSNPRKNPWVTEPMRAFRRAYHRALLEFLRTQPAPWRVTAAFLWDTGSWDPYGFDDAAFADPVIVEMIRHHNSGEPAPQ